MITFERGISQVCNKLQELFVQKPNFLKFEARCKRIQLGRRETKENGDVVRACVG